MVGQWFIEVVASVPAHRQVVPGLLQQLALRADAGEEHDQVQPEEDFGINGRATAAGVALRREIANEGEVEEAMEVPIEMILRHGGFHGDQDGTVEIAGLGRTEHGTPPSGRVEGGDASAHERRLSTSRGITLP